MKFLCHLKWKEYVSSEWGDGGDYELKNEIKVLTIDEMNKFVNKHYKSNIIVLKEITDKNQ